jgi:hypothetical protein
VRAEQARVIAEALAKGGIDNLDEAATNALRDLVFGMTSDRSRGFTVKCLLSIANLVNRAKANAIKRACPERSLSASWR